ncbi:siderophore transporter [Maudiozyma humilis]|uniref:Siderophore transporter n=1 Tax=Maudiozyma humilis TaxID=51915 RepID=A0AAV5RXK2_MAUHU|nr:siderophore transporter [Kazachstania humilis]
MSNITPASSNSESLAKEHSGSLDIEKTKSSDNAMSLGNGDTESLKDAGINNIKVYSEQYSHPVYRVMLFFSLFLIAYAYGLDGNIRYTFQAYATSSYSQHSLLSTVNCIKAVIAAAGQVWFARASDIWGRVPLLFIAVIFYVMGTIIESQATNVSRFAAGASFYQLGLTGIILIVELIASDFSNLNFRLLALFIPALPFIINTWISGNVTDAVGTRWKWGIGMWAFILPLSCIPLLCCHLHMRYLAKKNAPERLMKEDTKMPRSLREFWDNIVVELFLWKLDFVGLLLVAITFGLVLIPFTLAGGLNTEWKTAHIIVPEVLGWVVSLPLYILWEVKFARYPITPWKLIKDRGIYSALIIGFHINFIWYMQGDYMYTVLIVAVHESVKAATRITSLYSFVSVITGTILGLFIIKFKRTKPFIIFGCCCWFVSFGLLVHYRGNSGAHSGIIGSLCLLGFGAGFFTYTTQASIQASAKTHQKLGVITALYLASYNVGSAVGGSVSGAIWTQVLPKQIEKGITNSTLAAEAYGSPFTFITTYTWGTPEREVVVHAYRYVQKILCIVGLVFCIPLLGAAFLLRNYEMKESVTLSDAESMDEAQEKQHTDFIDKIFKRKTNNSGDEKKSYDDAIEEVPSSTA